MSVFDFFFPEQAQASHLRRLADAQARMARSPQPTAHTTPDQRVEQLERDLAVVCLVLGAMLDELAEKGQIRLEDLRQTIARLDLRDGVMDGRMNMAVLRDLVR